MSLAGDPSCQSSVAIARYKGLVVIEMSVISTAT